ncbi:MAG: TrbG/VirB9 family P-type conjugative transfer protein [Gammaproteobacteria bacterium]|nr:TrbG/VirB9 family P-type conjugative transfer protein [Gammaproteobacteria bacterium]
MWRVKLMFLKKRKKILKQFNFLGVLILIGSLTACTHPAIYTPKDFINPNRIISKTVEVEKPLPVVHATFGLGNNPAVIAAYRRFINSEKTRAPSIQSKGFKTFAYNAYAHPLLACAPLHLCVVQLEQGERINNINIGDSAHWLVGTALLGSIEAGSYQVMIKPKLYHTTTDLVITTDKRTYNIGLVSEVGQATHVLNFYYPEETLQTNLDLLKPTDSNEHHVVQKSSVMALKHIHFNYALSGDHPAWRPAHVFDDGIKTFIQMPAMVERLDLPVLYLQKGHQPFALVNYRYQRPYYIIDGLFRRAFLISGKGRNQVRVVITNQNFRE